MKNRCSVGVLLPAGFGGVPPPVKRWPPRRCSDPPQPRPATLLWAGKPGT